MRFDEAASERFCLPKLNMKLGSQYLVCTGKAKRITNTSTMGTHPSTEHLVFETAQALMRFLC